MLTKFSVSNFKGFNEEFVLDLQDPNGYEFNKESVKNGIVNHAIIYGKNGVGKSNLGLAIFDIVGHLTDLEFEEAPYSNYLNALNQSNTAQFHYEFLIDSNKVIYNYQKTDSRTIIAESFYINGKKLISIDRKNNNQAITKLKGTETLKTTINNNNLSVLKYIKNNSILDENEENRVFLNFFEFIEGLLFFKTLRKNVYLGLEVGSRSTQKDIIEKGNVSNLESFLNTAGIECKLIAEKHSDKDTIAFNFNGKTIPFFSIASTGTISLLLFYFWLQRLRESKVTFLFLDEFDAFYHHKLSALIVEELKKTGVQFILTTHNTSIITNDLLRPDCYFLMDKQSIKSLAKSTSKELRAAHNIEKMYKAGSFHAQ
ncbi:MAG: ATP/GTP-binding protein [Saprospiraceae bacterium]